MPCRVPDDARYLPPEYRGIAVACADMQRLREATETDVDWTYLSPAADLRPGPRAGRYRLGTDELLVDGNGHSAISMADRAVAMLDEVERPRHFRRRFTVAN